MSTQKFLNRRHAFCKSPSSFNFRNMYEKFKVDLLSRFYTRTRHMCPIRNLSSDKFLKFHENCKTKYFLNTFSDQLTICEISFEINISLNLFAVKHSFAKAERNIKFHFSYSYFSYLILFVCREKIDKKLPKKGASKTFYSPRLHVKE